MKKQVLVIHGGEVFRTHNEYVKYLKSYELDLKKIEERSQGWKKHLQEDLGEEFEVIQPEMPSPRNAKYEEWKIWLEKYIPFLRDDIILIGNSLGGIFWPKYLSENSFPVRISQLHLIAAPFGDNKDSTGETDNYNLMEFNLSKDLKNVSKQVGDIFLYHSEDDDCVPFSDLEKYSKELPEAKKFVFYDRGHFSLKEFPEIIKNIKSS